MFQNDLSDDVINIAEKLNDTIDVLKENNKHILKMIQALKSISRHYQQAECKIEEKYDSLWHVMKFNFPVVEDISFISEFINDITFKYTI